MRPSGILSLGKKPNKTPDVLKQELHLFDFVYLITGRISHLLEEQIARTSFDIEWIPLCKMK